MSLSITSFSFFCFVFISFVGYYAIPKNRWAVLGIASFIYYTCVSKGNVIWVMVSVLSVWTGGLLLDKNNTRISSFVNDKAKINIIKKRNRVVVCIVVSLNVGLLLFCKFTPDMMLPLAISFYTLSAVGYIIDVFKGGSAEKNPLKITTFLSFFPLLTQGPIVRYKKLNSLYEDSQICIESIASGLMLILWGAAKKQIIADRCNPLVNGVFTDYESYSGFIIVIAVIGYMLQLYCDFSGGIDIAIGVGQLFGVRLPQNFKQPYFSESISEFWRRWHISLGEWFKDYIYMPLAMSKLNNKVYAYLKNKKGMKVAKIFTTSVITFVIWLVNGIWHGAGWKYVLFGAYMGLIIVIENGTKMISPKKEISVVRHMFRHIRTLFLVAIGWMMIRVDSISQFIYMIRAVFLTSQSNVYLSISEYLGKMDIIILIFAVVVLLTIEIMQIKTEESLRDRIIVSKISISSLVWIALLISWLVLSYDLGNEIRGFIYAKF